MYIQIHFFYVLLLLCTGKLKELGNSFLGLFGMSTDNFQMQEQPGGGYSINIKQ